MMGKYRKRPVVIEAEQFTEASLTALREAVGGAVYDAKDVQLTADGVPVINTLEGIMRVSVGDWIITGVRNERYPCKDEIFRATYDPVEAS